MAKRTITLGKWNDKPIEWIVLKEEDFGTLVICPFSPGRFQFDRNSSNNNWGSCDLRKYLNGDFFNKAFGGDEKKKIVNASVGECKDNVFLPSEEEVKLLNQYGTDTYDNDSYNRSWDRCYWCYWTRTLNGSSIRHGYARKCWCSHSPTYTYAVRPAMYIKESAVKKTKTRAIPKIDTSTRRSEKS